MQSRHWTTASCISSTTSPRSPVSASIRCIPRSAPAVRGSGTSSGSNEASSVPRWSPLHHDDSIGPRPRRTYARVVSGHHRRHRRRSRELTVGRGGDLRVKIPWQERRRPHPPPAGSSANLPVCRIKVHNNDYRAEIMGLRSRCYSPRSVVGQRLRFPSRLFRLLPRSDPEVADGLCFALRSAHRAAGAPLHALKALRELPACVRARPGGTAVTSSSTSFRTTSANRVGAIPCLSSVGRAQARRRAARCGLA
jgi:hypothetical protein